MRPWLVSLVIRMCHILNSASTPDHLNCDNYQTIDAKPNLRVGDIPHHTSYHPGPTARSHGPSMFQVNHRNCLAGPVYDDIWNFPTRAGSQLGVRRNFWCRPESTRISCSKRVGRHSWPEFRSISKSTSVYPIKLYHKILLAASQ
ncbi:hypothetical protein JB92DRAFT_1552539 [Gautieria morchelliformis]|nr:hypothetical protein JB92DRAFT_1552539 [Gautieria morchelliformis]